MNVIVAVVGRAHGIKGEVQLDVRTDAPQTRLAAGQVLATDPDRGPLTVAAAREHSGKWLARFEQVPDRTAAEALRGVALMAPADDDDDPDAFYPHELVGMEVQLPAGERVGKVIGLRHGTAHDLLVISETGGAETEIPFVRAIVPDIDKEKSVVTIDPPGGLLARDADKLVVSDETRGASAGAGPADAEEAAELAAPLAPEPGAKQPGEFAGTLPAEDVDSHRHTGLPDGASWPG